ncbi:MAG: Ppx/GppA family phosphatase [Gammaproteobacteria bacterium]|nr:MAG: Ppx/GppA family phosphatase [Gammaproteobacteria bacterium]
MSNTPVTCAVADLGSNTFHLMIAEVEGTKFTVIDKIRYPVKLAEGFDNQKKLTSEAMQRGFDILEMYGQRLQDFHPSFVKIVGTNALRRAKNSQDFVSKATDIVGYPVEVISGYEEARLIYLGVARSIESDGKNRLLIDIGGGSSELVIGKDFDPVDMESLDVGCLSTTVDFFPKGEITKESMHKAVIATGLKIQPFVKAMKKIGWDHAIGSAGTIIAIASVLERKGWASGEISFTALDKLRKELVREGRFKGEDYPDISQDRANAFAGGAAVLYGLMKNLDIDTIIPCDGGLREGMLLDLSGKIEHEDIRDTAILQFARDYKYDEQQSERVFNAAAYIFKMAYKGLGLKKGSSEGYLRWASSVFEIGLAISHSKHHKHSAYLVKHTDLPGFTREEQQNLRIIVEGHRKSFPIKEIEILPQSERYLVTALCVIFRLAVLFCRSRNDVPLKDLDFKSDKGRLDLIFPTGWLEQNPLTEADLLMEQQAIKCSDWKLKLVTK